jgi:hypothetical protein
MIQWKRPPPCSTYRQFGGKSLPVCDVHLKYSRSVGTGTESGV